MRRKPLIAISSASIATIAPVSASYLTPQQQGLDMTRIVPAAPPPSPNTRRLSSVSWSLDEYSEDSTNYPYGDVFRAQSNSSTPTFDESNNDEDDNSSEDSTPSLMSVASDHEALETSNPQPEKSGLERSHRSSDLLTAILTLKRSTSRGRANSFPLSAGRTTPFDASGSYFLSSGSPRSPANGNPDDADSLPLSPFESLGDELLVRIFDYLSAEEICNFFPENAMVKAPSLAWASLRFLDPLMSARSRIFNALDNRCSLQFRNSCDQNIAMAMYCTIIDEDNPQTCFMVLNQVYYLYSRVLEHCSSRNVIIASWSQLACLLLHYTITPMTPELQERTVKELHYVREVLLLWVVANRNVCLPSELILALMKVADEAGHIRTLELLCLVTGVENLEKLQETFEYQLACLQDATECVSSASSRSSTPVSSTTSSTVSSEDSDDFAGQIRLNIDSAVDAETANAPAPVRAFLAANRYELKFVVVGMLLTVIIAAILQNFFR